MLLFKVKKNTGLIHSPAHGMLLTVFSVLLLLQSTAAGHPDDVIPSPRKTVLQDGALKLPEEFKVVFTGNTASASRLFTLLNEYINAEGYAAEKGSTGDALLTVTVKPGTPVTDFYDADESYQLRVGRKEAQITAVTARGAFYGLMTFVQLAAQYRKEGIPCMLIDDSPTLRMRGISDDVSRGQVQSIGELKRTLQWLARYKMNTYMPYLEDMLLLPGYPTIGKGRGAWSLDEVRELTAYAENHFITVIPIFQTLGHYENVLSKEEFLPMAEFPGAASLCFSCPATFTYLQHALEYVCTIFPGTYVHIGADESYDAGLYKSKALADSIGIERAYARHYEHVLTILRKHGKRAIMYGDMLNNHPGILPLLPKDMSVMTWSYRAEQGYPQVTTVASYKLRQITSPSVWNFTSTYPVQTQMFPNTKVMAREAKDNGGLGMVTSNWGDYGAETPKEFLFPGYAWSAQCSWTYEKAAESGFLRRFASDYWGVAGGDYEAILALAGNTNNQLVWHEFWRHPGLGQREPGWFEARTSSTAKAASLLVIIPLLERFAGDLTLLARKNRESGNVYAMLAKLYTFYVKKQEAASRLAAYSKGLCDAAALREAITDAQRELQRARIDFAAAWSAQNKSENLELIEQKFDRMNQYFEEIRDAARSDGPERPGREQWLLASEWIYPLGYDTTLSEPVTITGNFTLAEVPHAAWLQVLANTHASIVINGNDAGEVFVKRSLSLYTEDERILARDVARFLRTGKNTISCVVRNYYPNSSPGINVYLEARHADGGITAFTSGNADTSEGITWNATYRGQIVPVTVKKYPYEITAPNAAAGRKSRIER